MPKVAEEHLEARRRQIVEAAAACFARKGFHSTTIQEICQRAELSPGAVYRYFRSKDQIMEAMAEESLRRNITAIQAIAGRADTLVVVDDLAQFFFGMLEQPERCALEMELWSESMRNPEVRATLRRSLDTHREAFAEFVHQAQTRGEINPSLDPDSVARVMIALFDGLLVQRGIDPDAAVWPYVAVAKAMFGGQFWVSPKV